MVENDVTKAYRPYKNVRIEQIELRDGLMRKTTDESQAETIRNGVKKIEDLITNTEEGKKHIHK